MNEEAKAKLKEILRKEPVALTVNDIIFLKARREYLQKKYVAKFAQVLKVPTPEKKVVSPDPTDVLPEGEHPSYRDLQRRASELGVRRVVGKTRDQLNTIIAEREP